MQSITTEIFSIKNFQGYQIDGQYCKEKNKSYAWVTSLNPNCGALSRITLVFSTAKCPLPIIRPQKNSTGEWVSSRLAQVVELNKEASLWTGPLFQVCWSDKKCFIMLNNLPIYSECIGGAGILAGIAATALRVSPFVSAALIAGGQAMRSDAVKNKPDEHNSLDNFFTVGVGSAFGSVLNMGVQFLYKENQGVTTTSLMCSIAGNTAAFAVAFFVKMLSDVKFFLAFEKRKTSVGKSYTKMILVTIVNHYLLENLRKKLPIDPNFTTFQFMKREALISATSSTTTCVVQNILNDRPIAEDVVSSALISTATGAAEGFGKRQQILEKERFIALDQALLEKIGKEVGPIIDDILKNHWEMRGGDGSRWGGPSRDRDSIIEWLAKRKELTYWESTYAYKNVPKNTLKLTGEHTEYKGIKKDAVATLMQKPVITDSPVADQVASDTNVQTIYRANRKVYDDEERDCPANCTLF